MTSVIDSSVDFQNSSGIPSFLDWLLEAVILFVLAYLAEPMFIGWSEAFDIDFHASVYWVPVILLAVHYGLASGLTAALVATVLLLITHPTEAVVGEPFHAASLRAGFEPLAWTAVAAILGAIRTRSRDAESRLRQRLATETRTVEILTGRYTRLRDRVESLERALAIGTTPALRHTGRRLAGLAEMPASACRDQLYEILIGGTNGAQLSLYGFSDGHRVRIPQPLPLPGTTRLPPAATFPIRDGRGRALLEVHIERIDPEHFTETDQTHFTELCNRIGVLLEQRGVNDLVELAQSHEVA